MSKINAKKKGKYKSTLEWEVGEAFARRKGLKATYETTQLEYVIPATRHTYTPDWTIQTPSGVCFHLEVKGYFDKASVKKMLAVRQSHPNLDIRFFFPKDNKIPGRKQRYSEWCEKVGYQYCIGQIPASWLK